jgi:hypothetical protein
VVVLVELVELVEVDELEELEELDDEVLDGGGEPLRAVAVKLEYPKLWRAPQSSFRVLTPTAPAPCSAVVLSETLSNQLDGSGVPFCHTRALIAVGPAPVKSARIQSTTPLAAGTPVFKSLARLLPSLR